MSDTHDDQRRSVSGLFTGDELETELRSLRPVPLTDRTRRVIGRDLEAAKMPEVHPVLWRQSTLRLAAMASVLAAAAACIAVAISRTVSPTPSKQIVKATTPVPQPAANRATDPRQFAMAAYRRASAVSTDSLNALLDGQAAQTSGLSAEFQPRPVLDRGD